MCNIAIPNYNPSRHPVETWQEWYLRNQSVITRETEKSNETDIYDLQAHANLECKLYSRFAPKLKSKIRK